MVLLELEPSSARLQGSDPESCCVLPLSPVPLGPTERAPSLMLTPVILPHVLTLCTLPQAWDSPCLLFLGPKKLFLG